MSTSGNNLSLYKSKAGYWILFDSSFGRQWYFDQWKQALDFINGADCDDPEDEFMEKRPRFGISLELALSLAANRLLEQHKQL